MPVPKVLKVSRKTFVNPTGWMDIDGLKQQNRTIFQSVRALFTIDQPEREETFEEAVARLQLTDEDLKRSYQSYRRYAVFFALLGLVVFLYGFYLVFRYFSFSGWLLGMVSSALLLSQAFKYDFWAFQIKSRKLGATFEEWKRSILGA